MSHWNFVYGFPLKIFWGVTYWVIISPHDQIFAQISTCTSALISSVPLSMSLQSKSFNNRRFSEDVVHILCLLYFFHVPHSLWDNKRKGEKCATNYEQCLCFLTYFLPVIYLQIFCSPVFCNTFNQWKVITCSLQYNLNIKWGIL